MGSIIVHFVFFVHAGSCRLVKSFYHVTFLASVWYTTLEHVCVDIEMTRKGLLQGVSTMRTREKLCALAVALSVAMGPGVPAIAADTTPPAASSTRTGNLTLDPSIAIKGLQEGDTVTFYRVVRWDGNWTVAGTGFTLTDAEVATMIGNATTPGSIDSTLAAKIGGQVASATKKYEGVIAAGGVATVTAPEAGLYVGIITPHDAGYMYNPVFVAADWQPSNNGVTDGKVIFSNEWDVTTNLTYSDEGKAKKSELSVTKTAADEKSVDSVESTVYADHSSTVAAGDKVTFTINTAIPGFAANYTNPVFKVTDAMSEGLTLSANTIAITTPTGLRRGDDLNAVNVDYKVTSSANGFVIEFSKTYLMTVKSATPLTITYDATVDNVATAAMNKDSNEVTVNYSKVPTDTTGEGVLKDKTKHYTFDIDANLLGGTEYKNSEVVKVGVDKNGNEITTNTTLANDAQIGALEGAKFKLYKDYDKDAKTGTVYTNKYLTANSVIVSDSEGRLTVEGASVKGIQGLDAGTYWLVETEAPAGYVKAADPVKITITPTFSKKSANEAGVTYEWEELDSYVVLINDVETAKYTLTNEAANNGDQNGSHKISTGDANSGKIKNTQGVELPSTGGMGTRILYAIGGAMVLAGGVYLVVKRRVDDMGE